MLYKISLNLYKTLNFTNIELPTEVIRVFEQMISTRRQILFESFRSNRSKIGMNSNENKFYHINKQIPLATPKLKFCGIQTRHEVEIFKVRKNLNH